MNEGCDRVFEDGIGFEWDRAFNNPYKHMFSCALQTDNGKYVKLHVPDDYDTLVRFLATIPTYDETTLEDGLHTWTLYSLPDDPTVRFVAMRVKNAFEVGTLHKTIALAIGAKRIHGAGELLKSGTTLTYNLESGSFTKYWLESREKRRYCSPDELFEKIDLEFKRRFPEYTFSRIGMSMIKKSIPVQAANLAAYTDAGFAVELFDTQEDCKKPKAGGKYKRTLRSKRNARKTRKTQKRKY